MKAICQKCNTYYSVRQTRGTRLKDLRCKKDGNSLTLLSFGNEVHTFKTKDGKKYTFEIPLISGVTALNEIGESEKENNNHGKK